MVSLLLLSCCEKQNDIKSVEGLFVIEEIFMNDVIRSGVLSEKTIKDIKMKDKDIWDSINVAKRLENIDPDKSKEIIKSTKIKIECLSKEINQSK